MEFKAVATCAFGLESVLKFELAKLGVRDIDATDGRIAFSASGAEIARANVFLRTAERVLIVLGEFDAPDFDALFDGTKAIAWADVIDKRDAFPVKGFSLNSKLTSVPACQSIVKKAIVESLKASFGSPFLPEDNGVTKRIQFSIVKDRCTMMLDTSGDGLHKRGYRPLRNLAPIKETLAAGIADLARIRAGSAVVDPFCGSGTLVIESAMRAANIAPGLRRHFAGESYGFLGEGVFKDAKEQAAALVDLGCGFVGRGLDIDAEAAVLARANAKTAGVDSLLSFEPGDARSFTPRADEVILANPPYGERLGEPTETEQLMRDFGKNISEKPHKALYIISSDSHLEQQLGKPAARRRKLYNGMLPCQLYMYF